MTKFICFTRSLAILFLLCVMVDSMVATPRSVEQARQAAIQQMNKNTAKKAYRTIDNMVIQPQLVDVKLKSDASNEPAYYVFSAGQGNGFTVVSGDDRLPEIVGYTTSGDYDESNLPVNLERFMQSYQDFAANITDTQMSEISKWRLQAKHDRVVPFMKEQWGQDAPYNYLCPEYQSGKQSPTGCVATAIAQILHYYKFPVKLTNDIPEYYTDTYGTYMPPVLAEEHVYDWENMLDKYTGSEDLLQQSAVATLMYHVGCAVQMDYAMESGAAAHTSTFTKFFGMDKDLVRELNRSDYQIHEWDEILYNELVNGRPVYYEGASLGGAHAFVVHGYEDGLYYVNWGWNGYCDGYFDITFLNPLSTSGIGASSTSDGYSLDNCMIIGIQPDNGIEDPVDWALFTSGSIAVGDVYIQDNRITAQATAIVYNFNEKELTRIMSVGYKDEDGNVHDLCDNHISVTLVGMDDDGTAYGQKMSCQISIEYEPDHIYNLCVIESDDEQNWKASLKLYKYNEIAISTNGEDIEFIAPTSELSATAYVSNIGYAGMSNTINVNIENTGIKEYYDKIYVFVNNSFNRPNTHEYALGMTVPVDDSYTFRFEYTPSHTGMYYFWILDVYGEEIGVDSIMFEYAEPPVLAFTSINCDNSSDDKAYAQLYAFDEVEMNTVYDTKANVTFEIRNDGGHYEGMFNLFKYDADRRGFFSLNKVKLTLPAGETTKYTFSVDGLVGEVAGLMLTSANEDVSILGLPNDAANIHYIYEEGIKTSSFYAAKDYEVCYLAGNNTGDVSIGQTASSDNLNIGNSSKGCITIKANDNVFVNVHKVDGTKVSDFLLTAGAQKTINLPAGIYIVNKTKVVVR